MSKIVKILKEENGTQQTPEPAVLENTVCVEERKQKGGGGRTKRKIKKISDSNKNEN